MNQLEQEKDVMSHNSVVMSRGDVTTVITTSGKMADSRFRTSSSTNWCTTQSEIEPITFKWTIKNFSYHEREVGYFLQSSMIFSSAPKNGENWFLKASPNGANEECKGYLSLFLYRVHDAVVPSSAPLSVEEKSASIRCAVLDKKCEKSRYDFKTRVHHFIDSSGWGWHKFVKISDLRANARELLPHDTLTLLCEINLLKNVRTSSGEISLSKGPKCSLKDDMSYLYESKLFSDMTLVAKGKEFKVHKNILAARSTVFAAMFSTNMREKKQNTVNIVDMDVDVLRQMLHFIYSGKIPTDAGVKVYSNLLIAADKYNLERLKVKCEQNLCTRLTQDNVTDLLELAYLHNATELKDVAIDFILKQFLRVTSTDKWEHLAHSYPLLASEVFKQQLQKIEPED